MDGWMAEWMSDMEMSSLVYHRGDREIIPP